MSRIYTPGHNETTDLALGAALYAIGVDVDASMPFRAFEPKGEGVRWVFYFNPVSDCGRFATEDLVKVWNDAAWMESHPEHPWAYLWRAALAREEMLRIVKQAPPLVHVEHKGAQGMCSAHAPDWMVQKFFKRLQQKARGR